MFKLNTSGLKLVVKLIDRELKTLASVLNGGKQNSGKSSDWSRLSEYYIADSRRRNYIECYNAIAYSFLCYEHREDGTIVVV